MVNSSIAKNHSIKKFSEPIKNVNESPPQSDLCIQTHKKIRITIELDSHDAKTIFAIAMCVEKDLQNWIRRTLIKAAEEEWLRQ